MKKNKRVVRGILIFGTCLMVVCGLFACQPLKPKEMGSLPNEQYKHLSTIQHMTVMTVNTWRLREMHRVPRFLTAMAKTGRDLSLQVPKEAIPDIVLLQELEDEAVTARLSKEFSKTHQFQHCICATKKGSETRSAVGVAVKKARFEVLSSQCLSLGCLWPDHSRCAIVVKVKSRQNGAIVHVGSVHLSSRPGNAGQAKKLIEVLQEKSLLKSKRFLIGGDFNFHETSGGYRHMTKELRDFYPEPKKRGRTHWYGGRIDFLFVNKGLELKRVLNRKVAFDAFRVASQSGLSGACQKQDDPKCPLTDHLPEGGVFLLKP